VTDVVWTMKPGSSNTAGSFLPLVNIDDAEQYIGDYAFQLIVDKPSSYGVSPECTDYAASIYQQQVLSNVVQDPTEKNAFVINKAPKNAFVINETEPNAFVINSTFALAPSEPETSDPLTEQAKAQSIDDSETRNEAPSDQVRVTLRAFQLVPEPEFKFEPNPAEGGWLPSVAVADIGCGGGVDEKETDCFTIDGPNLIPESTITEEDQPLVADKCGTISFEPETFVVKNPNLKEGTKDAVTREKVAEGEPGPFQRHGFFLRGFDFDAEGNPVDRFLGEFTAPKTLAVGASISNLEEIVLKIPSDVEEGTYTLVFFADWPLKVSEYDETDNTLEFDLVIEAGAQFEGLQEPLYEINKSVPDTANGGSAVPLKWQYVDSNGTPVDGSDANPIVTFKGWFVEPGTDCSNPSSRSGDPDIAFIKDEDPGSSGLRYLGPDWQFNWQTKYPSEDIDNNPLPEAGDPLPTSCFEITITSTFTCEDQEEGPFLVQLN
jgi:hypothetical protein